MTHKKEGVKGGFRAPAPERPGQVWNFAGDFGIVGHGRPGAVYEEMGGYPVDRALLDILLESRVGA